MMTPVAPQPSPPPPPHRTPTQIEGDLQYLRQNHVCETLEMLVRQLLAHQPDDPILFICGQLRERCRSSSDRSLPFHHQHSSPYPGVALQSAIGGGAVHLPSHSGTSYPSHHGGGAAFAGSEHPYGGGGRLSSAGSAHAAGGGSVKSSIALSYLKDQRTQYMQTHPNAHGGVSSLSSQGDNITAVAAPEVPPISTEALMWGVVEEASPSSEMASLHAGGGGGPSIKKVDSLLSSALPTARSNTSAPSSASMANRTSNTATKAFAAVAPSAAAAAPPSPAAPAAQQTATSTTTSGNAAAALHSASIRSNTGSVVLTERDERGSARSDVCSSLNFSVASVDMQEFLGEFRAARNEAFGPMHATVNRSELADIVDRISVPLPDVRLIGELFDELRGSAERVPFEAFLARMNFKIQGRYPLEIIRAVYFGLLPPAEAAELAIRSATGGLESLGNTPRSTPLPATSPIDTRISALKGVNPLLNISSKSDDAAPNNGKHTASSSSAGGAAAVVPSPVLGRHGSKLSTVAPIPLNPSAVGPAAHSYSSDTLDTPPAAGTAGSSGPNNYLLRCSGVPKRRCVEEGLQKGLGMPMSLLDASRILASLGIPLTDDDALLQVTDFVALVTLATSSGFDE